MKTAFKLGKWSILALTITTFSCADDKPVVQINLQDLEVTIDENPIDGQVLGTVQTNGNEATGFTIESQVPIGALTIDSNSGELMVADANLFDFELHTVITANIVADNAINSSSVTINLNNLNEAAVPGNTDTEFVIGMNAYVTPNAYLLLDDAVGNFEREFSFVFTDGAIIEDTANGIAFETTTDHFTKVTCNLIGMSMSEAQLPIFTWPMQNPSTSIIMEGNNYTNIDITAYNNTATVGGLSFGQVGTSTQYSHSGQAQGNISHPTHLFTVNSITVDLVAGTGTIDCSYNYDDDNGTNINGVYVGTYEILTAF